MLVLIDNYDSFTYNVADLLAQLGADVHVVRNDQVTLAGIRAMDPTHVVISPGPGTPDSAGVSMDVARHMGGDVPVLGICLGMQCIAEAYGATVARMDGGVVHGAASEVHHDGRGVLRGMPSPFLAGRYHSLAVDPSTLPTLLAPTAHTSDGILMGLRHRELALEGVQFHPESILTPEGRQLFAAFLATTIPAQPCGVDRTAEDAA